MYVSVKYYYFLISLVCILEIIFKEIPILCFDSIFCTIMSLSIRPIAKLKFNSKFLKSKVAD
jgi:hypothetical protein